MVHPVWYIVTLGVTIGTVLFAYYNTARPQEHRGRDPGNAHYPVYPPDDGGSQKSTCSICLDTVPSIHMSRLSCGHSFHKRCIGKWIESNSRLARTCPNCRKHI